MPKTKVEIGTDEKNIEWIRASPVNLVVSLSANEIRIWTCKQGCEAGENVFRLKAIKEKNGWRIEYAKLKEKEA